MSLQRKFAALLLLFGLAVLGSIVSAVWSFTVLQREVAGPFESMTDALRSLGKTKRAVEEQADILLGEPEFDATPADQPDAASPQGVRGMRRPNNASAPTREEVEDFARLEEGIDAELDTLEALPTYRLRTGQYAGTNLRLRIDAALEQAWRWLREGDEPARADAGRQMYQIHELIERMEGRILEDAAMAEAFAQRMRDRLTLILGAVLAIALLVGILSLFLVRRWVVAPIGQLREAAAHIGRGDYAYRLEPAGRDELAQLGHEVNQMAGLIGQMQDERVERERLAAVGQMVRRLVHNIRNPLAGIRGLAETTRDELEGPTDLREAQQRIIDAVDGFERWLGDLLRETAPAEVHPEPTEVGPWIRRVISAHEAMASACGVRIDVQIEDPGERVFDPTHLEHAVAAVLANAVEASPRGGVVGVGVVGDAREWSIEVVDQGPGVAPELHQRIFEPHFTTKKRGTGTGLAAAQQVVRMHGGRIGVENLPGGPAERDGRAGARFRLVIPGSAEVQNVAKNGHFEADSGQNPDHRRRGEPPVLDVPGAEARGP